MAPPKGTLPPNFDNLVRRKFGRLRVSAYLGRSRWECRCRCRKTVVVTTGNLKTGNTTSCGCFRAEHTAAQKTTHGCARKGKATPEYRAWCYIKDRCLNEDHPRYAEWGGRGVTIDPAWLDFTTFLRDMGPRPSRMHSIDRRNNDGPYAAWNCRWATRKEQANNRRKRRWKRKPKT